MRAPMNTPVYQGFVSPLMCHYLAEAGIVLQTPYKWKVSNNEAVLHTEIFDLDGHYKLAFANVDFLFPCRYVPAFQLGDMEKLVPDYLVGRTANVYSLRCDDMFKLNQEEDERLPDVFAKMVLQALKKRILVPDNCIKTLTAQ